MFSKLQSQSIKMDVTSRRRSPFSRFELAILIPLVAFTAALAIFTIVDIVDHRGVVRPLTIAALCSTCMLLLAVGYVVFMRLRRPNACQDLESGISKDWKISAPIPISAPMKQTTYESKGSYTVVPGSGLPCHATLINRAYIVLKKGVKGVQSRSTLWMSTTQEDRQCLLFNGSDRSSTELSEDWADNEKKPKEEGLWNSVFELSGDAAKLEEKRRSEARLSAALTRAAGPDVKIVLTKPEAVVSQSTDRRASSFDMGDLRQSANPPASIDPLRSHPIQFLRRDPSVRQTKSSQTLASAPKSRDPQPALRRPRSAEPGPDRSRLGYDLATLQLYLDQSATDINSGWMAPKAKPTRTTPAQPQPQPQPQTQGRTTSQGLRRLRSPSPVGVAGQNDLRAEYRNGNGAWIVPTKGALEKMRTSRAEERRR
ncbi:hypothetical protein B0H63DRAFT_31701 [Podospora didyma]|uniref:Uncharacterized protein n=1 Tax=Podospora didyma TaxID=330526 RepID=A0AAE0P5V1_9PEZI|nr:hypothetical protein B0H63DRAFT_31701 [Podospora didyma]